MVAEDTYVLAPDGLILSAPPLKPYPHKPPICTDCAPLFMLVSYSSYFFSLFVYFPFYFKLYK